jgi:hypothetical protein
MGDVIGAGVEAGDSEGIIDALGLGYDAARNLKGNESRFRGVIVFSEPWCSAQPGRHAPNRQNAGSGEGI